MKLNFFSSLFVGILLTLSSCVNSSTNTNDSLKKDTSTLANIRGSIQSISDTVHKLPLSTLAPDALTDILGTWRIYKNVNRWGSPSDSTAIKNLRYRDKNQTIITELIIKKDGRYSLKSIFNTKIPDEDNGEWELRGAGYNINLLILKSHTYYKRTVNEHEFVYIVPYISDGRLMLTDGIFFNTMDFIGDDKPINR